MERTAPSAWGIHSAGNSPGDGQLRPREYPVPQDRTIFHAKAHAKADAKADDRSDRKSYHKSNAGKNGQCATVEELSDLPQYTLEALKNSTSPQSRAYQWMLANRERLWVKASRCK